MLWYCSHMITSSCLPLSVVAEIPVRKQNRFIHMGNTCRVYWLSIQEALVSSLAQFY